MKNHRIHVVGAMIRMLYCRSVPGDAADLCVNDTMGKTVQTRRRDFPSDDVRFEGLPHLPDGPGAAEGRPAMLLCITDAHHQDRIELAGPAHTMALTRVIAWFGSHPPAEAVQRHRLVDAHA